MATLLTVLGILFLLNECVLFLPLSFILRETGLKTYLCVFFECDFLIY